MTPSLRLVGSNLRCVRGNREVFSGLELAVANGETLLVTGANGTGKSSLLRLIAGLVRPTIGLMTLVGGDPDLTIPEQAHYLGHLDPLKLPLTVSENLRFWALYLGDAVSIGRQTAALRRVGLAELAAVPAAYLSAGQRRRLSLARLLAVQRPIWLLDEPASALDAAGQALLTDLMREHVAAGGLIVVASHEPLGLEGVRELRMGQAA